MNFLSPWLIFLLAIELIHIPSINAHNLVDNGSYPAFCESAAKDENIFSNFKHNDVYREILEHVSYEQGQEYLNFILKEYPDLVGLFDKFRRNDALGNPITYDYGVYGRFSPTTLRFIKIAGDLRKEFGDLSNLNILEIGTGYGGLCTILSYLSGFGSYSILDLPQCKALTKRNLGFHGIFNVRFFDDEHLPNDLKIDLLISNYGFSVCDHELQRKYLRELIQPSPNGYMTCNFFTKNSLKPEELTALLLQQGKEGRVETENPLTGSNNLLFVWKAKEKNFPTKMKERSMISSLPKPSQNNAISYSFSGGRLGDNLVSFLHAKWLSYKYQLPLIYTPFPFSDQFALSDPQYSLTTTGSFEKIIYIKEEKELALTTASTLFIIPYFPECAHEFEVFDYSSTPNFKVKWDDPIFHDEIVRSLTIKHSSPYPEIPNDCKTIAVHIRRGGGIDADNTNRLFPEKFPPDSYYIEQIRRVAEIYQNNNLYVYIFTDDLNPQNIINSYKTALNNPNIQWDCRLKDNNPNQNVVEDLIAMTKFDCLIRGGSNYALIASLIGNHELVINSIRGHWNEGQQLIDQVEMTFSPKVKR